MVVSDIILGSEVVNITERKNSFLYSSYHHQKRNPLHWEKRLGGMACFHCPGGILRWFSHPSQWPNIPSLSWFHASHSSTLILCVRVVFVTGHQRLYPYPQCADGLNLAVKHPIQSLDGEGWNSWSTRRRWERNENKRCVFRFITGDAILAFAVKGLIRSQRLNHRDLDTVPDIHRGCSWLLTVKQ